MKNGRKAIVCSIFTILIFAIIAFVFCVPYKSAKAEGVETEDIFVINKYNDGQAYLDGDNNIVVDSNCLGQTVIVGNGDWYTDGISEHAVLDTDESENATFVDFSPSNRRFSVSYYGENGECNIINACASEELAESVAEKSAADMYTANNLMSHNPIMYAGLQKTRTVTYNADGSRDTQESGIEWMNLSEDDVRELREYTDSPYKKAELTDAGKNSSPHNPIDVLKFVPEKYFGSTEGHMAFIGKEYGFVLCSYFVESMRFGNIGQVSHQYVHFLLTFAIDRQMLGTEREYSVKVRHALYASGTCYYFPRGKNDFDLTPAKDVFMTGVYEGDESMYISDPSFSASINNLYDINHVNEGYDLYKDNDISISQTRLNYCAYSGNFKKKKFVGADDVSAYVLSATDDILNITDTFIGITTSAMTVYPLIGVITSSYNIISNLVNLCKDSELIAKQIYANNEKNIITFAAPSQRPTKQAVTAFSKEIQIDSGKADAIIGLGNNNHYAQSIFVLNEVKKPIALSTNVNVFWGLGYPIRTDRIHKYSIPEEYNYSGMTVKLFDEPHAETVSNGGEAKVYGFADNTLTLNCVAESKGMYDLILKDFRRVIPYVKDGEISLDGSMIEQKLVDIDTRNGRIFKNVTYNVEGDTVRMTVNLERGENIVKLTLADYDGKPCYGAEFTAALENHIIGLKCGTTTKYIMSPGSTMYYRFTAERDGVYTIDNKREGVRLDIFNGQRRVLMSDVESGDVLLYAGESCYVSAKNTNDGIKLGSIGVTQKDSVSGDGFEGVIAAGNVGAWYPVSVSKGGLYEFSAAGDVTLRMKDGGGREVISGRKAVLTAGEYYLFVARLGKDIAGEVDFGVTVEFLPAVIAANRTYTVFRDTSYLFVPPVSGDYRLSGYSADYTVTVNDEEYRGGTVRMTGGERYIITAASASGVGSRIQINFVPTATEVVGFNTEFNYESAEFRTGISGEYTIAAQGVAVYTEALEVVNAVNGLYSLDADRTYYIINPARRMTEAVLYAKLIPVNTRFDVAPDRTVYYTIHTDGDGVYTVYADGKAVVEVFDYHFNRIAADAGAGGYTLLGGAIYYIGITTNANPDTVTVHDERWDGALAVTDGMMFESVFSDANNRAQFTFVPDENGLYKFVFFRDRGAEYAIDVECGGRTVAFGKFGTNKFVLTFSAELTCGVKYNICAQLESAGAGSTVLAFGAYKAVDPHDFVVYACGKPQYDGAEPNIIELSGDSGYTHSQIAVAKLFGDVRYTVLDAPMLKGTPAVAVNGGGMLTVNNGLPQFTAFAVEVNIGRCVYGDLVLDEGLTKVVSFVIYNKVVNIDIFDENNACVTVADVAPNSAINLYAEVYPLFAAQADSLRFYIADSDKQYVELTTDGNGARVFGKVTTPNNTYVKVYAACGSEFTVVVLVRVHAEEIYAYSDGSLGAIDNSRTAYEIIAESGGIGTLDLSAFPNVNYLKIRGGSVKALNAFELKLGGGAFVLIFEDITVYGAGGGVLSSDSGSLAIYFIGNVSLYGRDGTSGGADGGNAINVKSADMYQVGNGAVVIGGGNGYCYGYDGKKHGGHGGAGIYISGGTVRFADVYDFYVRGGAGGTGASGINGAHAVDEGVRGGDGDDGFIGGNGGMGIGGAGALVLSGNKIEIRGGAGGNGGDGGNGGHGGNGSKGKTDGTDGGRGGDGGAGGDGGFGGSGNAAIGVGSVSHWQTNWLRVDGSAGLRGNGGNGGNGGRGGDGADDSSVKESASHGGRGGNGGNGGDGSKNGRMGDGGDGGNGGNPGSNGAGKWGGSGGYGYNGGNGGNGASTSWAGQKGGGGGNGGDAYGGTVGQGGKGGSGGFGAKDGTDGASGVQHGEQHKV